jgi:hypothetical protein
MGKFLMIFMATCQQPRQRSEFGFIERFTFFQITSDLSAQFGPDLLILVYDYYTFSKAAAQGGLLTPPEERQRKAN